MVGVLTVDEVDWLVFISSRNHKGGRKNVHTKSIRTNVVTGETIDLSKLATVNGSKVEKVLPTLPY